MRILVRSSDDEAVAHVESAVAEANLLPGEDTPGTWWVVRVVVRDPADRGHGWGSQAMRLLIQQVQLQGGQQLLVVPGGYGEDVEQQQRFYLRLGFKRDDQDEGLFRLGLVDLLGRVAGAEG